MTDNTIHDDTEGAIEAEIDEILRKHEENRFSFGDILNRKYTRQALLRHELRAATKARKDELESFEVLDIPGTLERLQRTENYLKKRRAELEASTTADTPDSPTNTKEE